MTNEIGTEGVVAKVQKLLRLSTSNNPNEAALAAAKAQELIDRYQLTQTMLAVEAGDPRQGLDDEPIINFADAPLDSPKQLDRWRTTLAMILARRNACKIWRLGPKLMIVGRPSDAETVRYVYGWLSGEVERLAVNQGAGKGRTWRNNFRLGVIDTIARKLREQERSFTRTIRMESKGNPQALIRINEALSVLTERRMDVARWTRQNMKLYASSGGGGATYDESARRAGRRAGEMINVTSARRSLEGGARRLTA